MAQRGNPTDETIARLKGPSLASVAKSKSHSILGYPGLRVEVTRSGRKMFYFSKTVNGQKLTEHLGEFPIICLEQAYELANAIKAEIEGAGIPSFVKKRKQASLSFQQFVEEQFLPFAFQSKLTAREDQSKYEMYLLEAFGKKPLMAITRKNIEQFHVDMAEFNSPATANRYLSLIARIFSKALEWGVVTNNPAKGIKKFREPEARPVLLTMPEIHRLFDAMNGDENWVAVLAIKFLLLTGLRRNEALQAEWQHINIDQRTLYLPQTKSGRSRLVPLSDAAMDIILELKAKACGPFVFPGRDPKRPYFNVNKPLDRYLQRAGLPHMRVHDLRHGFATMLVNQGVSIYQIKGLLGHESVKTTQRYSHLSHEVLRASSQLVGDALMKSKINLVSI